MISVKPKFGSEYEAVILTNSLRKEKDTAYSRSDAALTLWALPGIAIFVLIMIFSERIVEVSVNLYYIVLAFSVALCGIGLVIHKKGKLYVYHYKSGEIAFDICENGNEIEVFEGFCNEIDKRTEA